ncbi:MAG: arginine--tRNA ligase [Candidatus Shapirobacteria bacterium]|nr:arginine--tRNA ligase [Candidatus Shapirobacteria bacterium]
MNNIVKIISDDIFKVCAELGIKVNKGEIKLEHPADTQFGDYATSLPMGLAKSEHKSPNEIAGSIKARLDKIIDKEIIEKVEIAGAGFINFYLKKEFLIKEAEVLNYELEFKNKLSEVGHGKTLVIDYSAPNIAKPFGIGHLRSTNIGQSLYNLYKILGWNTIGDNHIGDWGTQFGKLIVAIKRLGSAKQNLDDLTIEDLEKLYVKFHKEAETNPELVDEGRDWFSKLENGDKEAKENWQKCIDISFKEYDQVYELLDVKIDEIHGESFYANMLPEIIDGITKKGITKISDGALIIEFDDMPPAMLRKSNGTTTYLTRDMATIKYRKEIWNPDMVIYEVGADQQLHFRQVFKIAELMGWMPKEGLVHVAHGLIRWPTGKFSTRKGDTIHLSDVIDRAMEKAEEIANKSQVSKDLSTEEKKEMIKNVAIGAIKFNDLSSDPKRDIVFDWDQVMSLEGDSGPYLQYTYARCCSVLDKTKIKEQKNINNSAENLNPEELALLKEFYKFEEKIIEAATRFSPSVVAEYLINVARKYNEFYGKHRILDQPEENFRIFLTKTTSSILEIGLKLLGIKPIEKM